VRRYNGLTNRGNAHPHYSNTTVPTSRAIEASRKSRLVCIAPFVTVHALLGSENICCFAEQTRSTSVLSEVFHESAHGTVHTIKIESEGQRENKAKAPKMMVRNRNHVLYHLVMPMLPWYLPRSQGVHADWPSKLVKSGTESDQYCHPNRASNSYIPRCNSGIVSRR
jgi:hypothetical protein